MPAIRGLGLLLSLFLRPLLPLLGMFATLALLSACASAPMQQPVHTATIIESQPSLRNSFTPSGGGAVAGGVAGGVLGNQIGKGNGRKLATVLGAVAGATAGAVANGTTSTVPVSLIVIRDDESGAVYRGTFDGQWRVGARVRYTMNDGHIVLH